MKKREAFVRMLGSYYRFDRCAWFLLGCFFLGFLLSSVLIRFEIDFVITTARVWSKQVMFEYSGLSFLKILLQYFVSMSVSYIFVLTLGLFVPGEALSFLYLIFEGARVGSIFAFIYHAYQMQGVLFVFAVLLIPTFGYVLCLIFAFRGTIHFSLTLLHQFLGKHCENLMTEYKAFLIRSLLCPLGFLGSAVCGAGLQRCFAVLFSFDVSWN